MDESLALGQRSALFFQALPKILGIKHSAGLYDCISEHLGINKKYFVDTIKKGELPNKDRYNYDEIIEKLPLAMEQYIATSKTDDQQASLRKRWTEKQQTVYDLLKVLFIEVDAMNVYAGKKEYEILGENSRELFSGFQSIFKNLSVETAYRLTVNFEGYNSVTADDIVFMGFVLELEPNKKEKLRDWLRLCQSRPAGLMIDHIESTEMQKWLAIRNSNYGKTCKLGEHSISALWGNFLDTVKSHPCNAPSLISFLMLILIDTENVVIDEDRFGKTEIDLLLLFKYCISTEVKEILLQEMKKTADAP